MKYICDLAKTIDINLIRPIFEKVINYNSAIAEEGLKGKYGVNIGKMILDNIERGIYGNDIRNKAASYASAASGSFDAVGGVPADCVGGYCASLLQFEHPAIGPDRWPGRRRQ